MSRQEIAHEQWKQFADAFSRQHDGWLLSIYAKQRDGERECLARSVKFRGVTVDKDGEPIVITADGQHHLAHIIAEPEHVVVERTADAADSVLSITDSAGVTTTAEFCSPMPATMVDGVIRNRREQAGD